MHLKTWINYLFNTKIIIWICDCNCLKIIVRIMRSHPFKSIPYLSQFKEWQPSWAQPKNIIKKTKHKPSNYDWCARPYIGFWAKSIEFPLKPHQNSNNGRITERIVSASPLKCKSNMKFFNILLAQHNKFQYNEKGRTRRAWKMIYCRGKMQEQPRNDEQGRMTSLIFRWADATASSSLPLSACFNLNSI